MDKAQTYAQQLLDIIHQVSSPLPPRRIAMMFERPNNAARVVIVRQPNDAKSPTHQLHQAVSWLLQHGSPRIPYMGKPNIARSKQNSITIALATAFITAYTSGSLTTTAVAAALSFVVHDTIATIHTSRQCQLAAHELITIVDNHPQDYTTGPVTDPIFEHFPNNGISIAVLPFDYAPQPTGA